MTQLDLFNAPPAAFEYPNSEPPQEYQIIYCDPPWDYDETRRTVPDEYTTHHQ